MKKTSKKDNSAKKATQKLSKNYWTYSTMALSLVVIVLAIIAIHGSASGAVIGASEAGQKVVDFASAQGADATVVEVNDDGSLYEVVVSIQGQDVPVYITKDGNTLAFQTVSLEDTETTSTTTSTPACYHNKTCDLEQSVALMDSVGIDSEAVLSCVESKGEELQTEHYNLARENGVSGSPTLRINGETVSVARTAEAYESAICSAFTEESLPSECEGISDISEEIGIEKTSNPSIELYIWSYCPYGVTAQEPFAQVAQLLKDYAEFNIYLYYAGHGDFEEQQNQIQACIQDLGYEEEYWNYAQTFVEEIYPSITSSSGATSSGSC